MEEMSDISNDVLHSAMSETSQASSNEFDDLEKSSIQGKYHKQSYRKAWESLPDFKGWLRGVEGQPNRAYCSFCEVTLFAHRLSLLKHTCTLKHQKASQKAILKSNGITNNDSRVNFVPSTSQSNLRHISAENLKLNLRPLKAHQNISSNMTVTIIEDGGEEPLEMQLQQNLAEGEGASLVPDDDDDDDLGLNTAPSAQISTAKDEVPATVLPSSKAISMAHSSNFPLSTHVLDTSKGQPATQVPVSLYRLMEGRWTLVNESVTNHDGRCSTLIERQEFVAGRYKLHFDTDKYFELERKETLYPFVEIAFDVRAPLDHYHIPLLLSAFGYSTYRGS